MISARARMNIMSDMVDTLNSMRPVPPPMETELDEDDGVLVHRWINPATDEWFSLTTTGNGYVTGYFISPTSSEPAWRLPVTSGELAGKFPASFLRQDKEQSGGWQDISDAPKDGTTILFFFPENGTIIDGHWGHTIMCPDPNNPEHWQWDTLLHWSNVRDEIGEPSHWMPMPALPTKATRS